jgi:hypothetical protein
MPLCDRLIHLLSCFKISISTYTNLIPAFTDALVDCNYVTATPVQETYQCSFWASLRPAARFGVISPGAYTYRSCDSLEYLPQPPTGITCAPGSTFIVTDDYNNQYQNVTGSASNPYANYTSIAEYPLPEVSFASPKHIPNTIYLVVSQYKASCLKALLLRLFLYQ